MGRRTNQSKERSALEQIFYTIDTDLSGLVDFDELKVFFDMADQVCTNPMDRVKTMEQLRAIDHSGDGILDTDDFVEFFLTQLPEQKDLREEALQEFMKAALAAKKKADAKDRERQSKQNAKAEARGTRTAESLAIDVDDEPSSNRNPKAAPKTGAKKEAASTDKKELQKKGAIATRTAKANQAAAKSSGKKPAQGKEDQDKSSSSPPPSPREIGRPLPPNPFEKKLKQEERVVQKANIVAAVGKEKLDLTMSSGGQISDMLRKTVMTQW